MSTALEIVKIISPACITGLITFIATKFNYDKNIPIDKLEITFNKVYYPIYRLLKYSSEDKLKIIDICNTYFEKYDKYFDPSTIVAFKYLKNNPNHSKAYTKFQDNIYGINSKLRRRLGYLESNMFGIYTYSAPKEKRLFRIIMEVVILCIFAEFTLFITYEPIQKICEAFLILFLLVLVIEFIAVGINNIFSKIRNVIVQLKAKGKTNEQSNTEEKNQLWNSKATFISGVTILIIIVNNIIELCYKIPRSIYAIEMMIILLFCVVAFGTKKLDGCVGTKRVENFGGFLTAISIIDFLVVKAVISPVEGVEFACKLSNVKMQVLIALIILALVVIGGSIYLLVCKYPNEK